MDDRKIISLFWQRSEDAIRQTNFKYGAYCFAVANAIVDNAQDAEECVSDAWLAAWNSIPPHRPKFLRGYLAKIVRNLAFNCYESSRALKRGGGELPLVLDELGECIAGSADVEQSFAARELEAAVARFVRHLPQREGDVFIRRYFFCEPVEQIARRYGMTGNYVSVMLSRVRKKLKNELIREGYLNG